MEVGLSQICSKSCLKCFWNILKFLPIMLFKLPILLVLCFNINNIDVKFHCLNVLLEYLRYEHRYVLFYELQCILNALLECIELFNTV